MTFEEQVQLSCEAKQICKCFKGNQTMMIAAMLAVMANLAGVPVDCDTLKANAAQYGCIPPQLLIPALIWILSQIQGQIPPSGAGFVFAGDYGGNPPPFSPTTPGAIATDTSTGQQWVWFSGVWH